MQGKMKENTFDDYLFIKDEFNDIQKQVTKLEGEMLHNKENEESIKNGPMQSGALNELNQELPNDLNEFSDGAHSIEEMVQTKNSNSISTDQRTTSPPSFRQLQGLVGKAIQKHEVPINETPSQKNNIIENLTEESPINKQSFLPSSTQPSQLYNGLYRNISLKTTIQYEYKNDKSTNSVRVNEFMDNPHALVVNEVVDRDLSMEETSPVQEPIETILEESETIIVEPETITVKPEAVTKKPETISEELETVIEELETITDEIGTAIEAPETKKQESNKETFSMFNIFKRRI